MIWFAYIYYYYYYYYYHHQIFVIYDRLQCRGSVIFHCCAGPVIVA